MVVHQIRIFYQNNFRNLLYFVDLFGIIYLLISELRGKFLVLLKRVDAGGNSTMEQSLLLLKEIIRVIPLKINKLN